TLDWSQTHVVRVTEVHTHDPVAINGSVHAYRNAIRNGAEDDARASVDRTVVVGEEPGRSRCVGDAGGAGKIDLRRDGNDGPSVSSSRPKGNCGAQPPRPGAI